MSEYSKNRWNRTACQIAVVALLAGLMVSEAAVAASPNNPSEFSKESSAVRLENRSLPVGMSALSATVNTWMTRSLDVKVTAQERPVPGTRVVFLITSVPAGATGARMSDTEGRTDAAGLVTVRFRPGDRQGIYVVSAFHEGRLDTPPVHFVVQTQRRMWPLFMIFGLLGGLGIFLLGMEFASGGLKTLAGDSMKSALARFTGNRVSALMVGVISTVVLQSSSASTSMLVGFVDATVMNLLQAMGVIIGTKIGTSVTMQFIAFNLTDYALFMVAVGLLLRLLCRQRWIQHTGETLLGIGLLFFGLWIMGDAMRPMRTEPLFYDALAAMGDRPVQGILLAAAFTVVVQSSASTIGLAIALCASDLLTLEASLPMAFGAHIGTCISAILASIGTGRAGKQVATAHLLISVTGVLIAFPFIDRFVEGARWVTAAMGSTSVARELVNGHTLFTVVTGFFLLPFIRPLHWVVHRILPIRESETVFAPKYINELSLKVPAVALDLAQREILRMMTILQGMLQKSMEILARPDSEAMQRMDHEDDKVDCLERAIRPYLARLGQQSLSREQRNREILFVSVLQDLEAIGDLLTKEIAHTARKLERRELTFSAEGLSDLSEYHARVMEKRTLVEGAFSTLSREGAAAVLDRVNDDRALERQLRILHLERLHSRHWESLETSTWHLSVLGNLRAVSERLDSVARAMIE